jgi:hypothetical protein
MNVDILEDGLFLSQRALSPRFTCGQLSPRFIRGHRTDSRPYARAPTDVWGKPVGST